MYRLLTVGPAQAFPNKPVRLIVPLAAGEGVGIMTRSTIWFGLFGVAGTPLEILKKIRSDVARIAKRPDFAEKNMTSCGIEVVANSPAEFENEIQSEVEHIAEMVKVTGLQPK